MKTHYRKVFKSDHLGTADLEEMLEEGKKLVFTIKEVKQEFNKSVAGKKGNFNIAYFKEKIKPLVLNATNSKILKGFCSGSPFVEDWNNVLVELYIKENVRAVGGGQTDGVRIREVQPKKPKKPTFTEANFEKAFKANATIEQIRQVYELSDDVEKLYLNYGTKK